MTLVQAAHSGPGTQVGVREWVARFFGLESDWERPRPPVTSADGVLAVLVAGYGLLGLEFFRSTGSLVTDDHPIWAQWLAVGSGAALLVGRRQWPLVVAVLAAAHMFVVGVTMPQVMAQFTLQLVYFFAMLSGVAWARDRRAAVIVMAGIVLFMAAWLCWQFAVGTEYDAWAAELGADPVGWFGPGVGMVGYTMMVNAVFFGGAVVAGAMVWRAAERRAFSEQQSATIAAQSRELSEQAVVRERLRIARELHDVVAHHVSAIGVQAGAARRVLSKAGQVPVPATVALTNIEEASREAVTQMRGLLGTLREGAANVGEAAAADPSIVDLDDLVAAAAVQGVQVSCEVVEERPGGLAQVDRGLLLSAFRTAQEALTNVARHSTATSAVLVVRQVERPQPYLEVEVVDDGRPRGGTSGSGLGQLGIRERAATHRGEVEVGPRVTGGYRVRVRYPLRALPGDV